MQSSLVSFPVFAIPVYFLKFSLPKCMWGLYFGTSTWERETKTSPLNLAMKLTDKLP